MKLATCLFLIALPLPAAADEFGAQGTFLPKGGLSVSHYRFSGQVGPSSFTSIGIAPELGYFVIDDLVVFASAHLQVFLDPTNTSIGGGGGLGLGYHFDFGNSFGLLPQIGATLSASRVQLSTSLGVVAHARLPVVFTRHNLYFGIGPEVSWSGSLRNDPGRLDTIIVGLFTEIGGWL